MDLESIVLGTAGVLTIVNAGVGVATYYSMRKLPSQTAKRVLRTRRNKFIPRESTYWPLMLIKPGYELGLYCYKKKEY